MPVILTFIMTITAYTADEEKQVTYSTHAEKKKGELEALLENKKVKPRYEECLEKQKTNTSINLADCIWNQLDDQTKKEIRDNMQSSTEPSRTTDSDTPEREPASEKNEKEQKNVKKYEGLSLGTLDTGTTDPAIKKLKKYLHERLEKAMYGDLTSKERKIVDHEKFLALYKTQLGKNIISGLSSYCIEANLITDINKSYESPVFYGDFLIPVDETTRKTNRVKNIRNLTTFQETGDGSVNKVYKAWEKCVGSIKSVCYLEAPYNTSAKKPEPYQKQRACQITQFLKEHRQNLIASTKLEGDIIRFRSKRESVQLQTGMEHYTGRGDDEKTLDEITNYSSGEIDKVYGEKMREVSKEFHEKCVEGKDKEECQKYLTNSKTRKKLDKHISEYELRKKVMQEKINKIGANGDKKELQKYLEEEGYSAEEVEKMMKADTQALAKMISARYENERKAVIESYRDYMDKHSTTEEEIKLADNAPDMKKIKDLSTELSEKPEHYKQMLHFSNIISGFLKVDDGSGNKRRNTSAMFAEIENSDRAPSSSDESSMVDIKKISDALKNAGISRTDPEDDNEKHADTVQLEVKVINKAILNYDVPSPPPDSSNP